MTKSLTNRIYLKGLLFGFRVGEDRSVEEALDEFAKIVIDLENIEVKVADEDQVVLCLEPSS